jgi:hypothetical protein
MGARGDLTSGIWKGSMSTWVMKRSTEPCIRSLSCARPSECVRVTRSACMSFARERVMYMVRHVHRHRRRDIEGRSGGRAAAAIPIRQRAHLLRAHSPHQHAPCAGALLHTSTRDRSRARAVKEQRRCAW